jgi:hypothetical protein
LKSLKRMNHSPGLGHSVLLCWTSATQPLIYYQHYNLMTIEWKGCDSLRVFNSSHSCTLSFWLNSGGSSLRNINFSVNTDMSTLQNRLSFKCGNSDANVVVFDILWMLSKWLCNVEPIQISAQIHVFHKPWQLIKCSPPSTLLTLQAVPIHPFLSRNSTGAHDAPTSSNRYLVKCTYWGSARSSASFCSNAASLSFHASDVNPK